MTEELLEAIRIIHLECLKHDSCGTCALHSLICDKEVLPESLDIDDIADYYRGFRRESDV